ncbi:MAG: hypothetical protein KY450_13125, partial [Actinobacteria bacterium]|nr:hypothetical protein [Actinomycetota bacterium]
TGISFTPGDEAQVAVAGKAVVLDGMRSALAQLPLDERLPINLAYLGKLTYTEIAQVLEWPEGTVTMGILRGLHRLREREKLH